MPLGVSPRSCPEFTDFATPQKDESPEVALEASNSSIFSEKINVICCGKSPNLSLTHPVLIWYDFHINFVIFHLDGFFFVPLYVFRGHRLWPSFKREDETTTSNFQRRVEFCGACHRVTGEGTLEARLPYGIWGQWRPQGQAWFAKEKRCWGNGSGKKVENWCQFWMVFWFLRGPAFLVIIGNWWEIQQFSHTIRYLKKIPAVPIGQVVFDRKEMLARKHLRAMSENHSDLDDTKAVDLDDSISRQTCCISCISPSKQHSLRWGLILKQCDPCFGFLQSLWPLVPQARLPLQLHYR